MGINNEHIFITGSTNTSVDLDLFLFISDYFGNNNSNYTFDGNNGNDVGIDIYVNSDSLYIVGESQNNSDPSDFLIIKYLSNNFQTQVSNSLSSVFPVNGFVSLIILFSSLVLFFKK